MPQLTGPTRPAAAGAGAELVEAIWPPLEPLSRWAQRHPAAADALAALGLDLLTMVPLLQGGENRWWVWLLDQLLVAPLVVRRRHPTLVFAVVSGLAFVQWLTDVPLAADAALLAALYTVAAHESRARALVAALVLEIGVILAAVRFAPATDGVAGSLVFLSGLVTAALLSGITLRTRRAYFASVVDRAARLERERDQQARLAATAERNRIAREMHDIVAHSLSVVIALADGAALTNGGGDPQATAAMRQVSATGREAQHEMRRLLGVLRDEEAPADLVPAPRVAGIPELVEQFRSAGLPITLTVTGRVRPMAPSAETTAYRIVQESLTNVLKHAKQPTVVAVRMRWTTDGLEVTVTDDGRGVAPNGPIPARAGHGLAGMAERAAMFAGSLSAGRRPAGGWQVAATIPASIPLAVTP